MPHFPYWPPTCCSWRILGSLASFFSSLNSLCILIFLSYSLSNDLYYGGYSYILGHANLKIVFSLTPRVTSLIFLPYLRTCLSLILSRLSFFLSSQSPSPQVKKYTQVFISSEAFRTCISSSPNHCSSFSLNQLLSLGRNQQKASPCFALTHTTHSTTCNLAPTHTKISSVFSLVR